MGNWLYVTCSAFSAVLLCLVLTDRPTDLPKSKKTIQDAASPRYIFTALQKVARAVFHPDDDALLTYLDDDGLSIEPEFYVPVIPLILVNGSDGIGTGWSSQVRDGLE